MEKSSEAKKVHTTSSEKKTSSLSRRDFLKLAATAAAVATYMWLEKSVVSKVIDTHNAESIEAFKINDLEVIAIYGRHTHEHYLPNDFVFPKNFSFENQGPNSDLGAFIMLFNFNSKIGLNSRKFVTADKNSQGLGDLSMNQPESLLWGLMPIPKYQQFGQNIDLVSIENTRVVPMIEQFVGLMMLVAERWDKSATDREKLTIPERIAKISKDLFALYLTAPELVTNYFILTKDRKIYEKLMQINGGIHPEIGVLVFKAREYIWSLKLDYLNKNNLLKTEANGTKKFAMTMGGAHTLETTMKLSNEEKLSWLKLWMPFLLEVFDGNSLYQMSESMLTPEQYSYVTTNVFEHPDLKELVINAGGI